MGVYEYTYLPPKPYFKLLSQVLIKQIESSDSVYTISSAISNLLSLTQDGPQLCSIIANVSLHYTVYTSPSMQLET